jgi:protein phosphatase
VLDSRLDVAGLTDIGRKRKRNEDNFGIREIDGAVLCIVADGMGGHQGGDVASRLAVDGVLEAVREQRATPADRLRAAVESANLAVWREAERQPQLMGMGTTLVCVEVTPELLHLAHVGDSRAYLVEANAIRQLTVDHSWVGEQVAAGKMTAEEAVKHPFRGAITRCVGCQPTVDPDIQPDLPFADGTLLLCTDGLTGHVTDEEIQSIVLGDEPAEAARKLIDLANERGGTDNITVVVLGHARTPGAGDGG